jgi:regulatory protein YycI of two-component signal transduction system YycFG
MKKIIISFFLLFFIGYGFFFYPSESHAEENYKTTAAILDTAEMFFISLKEKKYGMVWALLSEKSCRTIITDIYKASKENGEDLKKEDIKSDFDKKGIISNTYWDSFLQDFDPDMVLEESSWEMGPVNKDKAKIIILHKKSEHPAILQMFKENGVWKFGFSETFGVRKF